jgi:hypothetical protein
MASKVGETRTNLLTTLENAHDFQDIVPRCGIAFLFSEFKTASLIANQDQKRFKINIQT